MKVAQNPLAVKEWKTIATTLGVNHTELAEIEQEHDSVQQKCFHSLRKWENNVKGEASLSELSAKLRICQYRNLARKLFLCELLLQNVNNPYDFNI